MFHIKQNDTIWQESHATQEDSRAFLERTTGKRFQPYTIDVGVIGLFSEEELLARVAPEFMIVRLS